jgi:hypothetical protein
MVHPHVVEVDDKETRVGWVPESLGKISHGIAPLRPGSHERL